MRRGILWLWLLLWVWIRLILWIGLRIHRLLVKVLLIEEMWWLHRLGVGHVGVECVLSSGRIGLAQSVCIILA